MESLPATPTTSRSISLRSRTSFSNESHPALESSEILQHLFKLLPHKHLIQLRSISKIWNEEVCLILRETSYVHLGGKSEESLNEIYTVIKTSKQLNIFSPFKHFFIYFREKPQESITKILEHPEFLVSGFNYHRDGSIYTNDLEAKQVLRSFLSKHGGGMSHIIYVFDLDSDEIEVEEDEVDAHDPRGGEQASRVFALVHTLAIRNQNQTQIETEVVNNDTVGNANVNDGLAGIVVAVAEAENSTDIEMQHANNGNESLLDNVEIGITNTETVSDVANSDVNIGGIDPDVEVPEIDYGSISSTNNVADAVENVELNMETEAEEAQQQQQQENETNSTTAEPESTLFKLPILETFEYWEREVTTQCESLEFLSELLSSGPKIKKFVTNTQYPAIFIGLVNKHFLENLNDMHLIDCKPESFNILTSNSSSLPNLQSLALQYWHDTTQRMSLRRLSNLVNKVRTTIKEISISCVDFTAPAAAAAGIQQLPFCPQLETLLLHDWRGSLNSFTKEKLPNLKNLHVSNFGMDIENHDDFHVQPHPNVTHFGVRGTFSVGGAGVRVARSNVEVFVSLLDFACAQYPNLTSLNLTMEAMPSKLVMAVIRIFPLLEILELQLYSEEAMRLETYESIEDFFTGINPHTLERAMSSFEFSDLRRSPCLLDMKKLRKLILKQNGFGVLLTDNSIKYGVSRIDSLKSLTFDMNPVLTNDVICEFLNHIPELIVLLDSKRMEELFDEDTVEIFDDVVTDLSSRLPQLIIDKSGMDPIEKFDFRNY